MDIAEVLTPEANKFSAAVHGIIKPAACALPTTTAAIMLGVMVARQVLTETLSFAARSMEGEDVDAQAVMDAALAAFDLLAPSMVEAK